MGYKDYEKQKYYQRIWKRRQNVINREKVLNMLGSRCVDCGIDDVRVLELDHKELQHRNKSHVNYMNTGCNLVSGILSGRIKKDSVEIRCANCHKIKTNSQRNQFRNYLGDIGKPAL